MTKSMKQKVADDQLKIKDLAEQSLDIKNSTDNSNSLMARHSSNYQLANKHISVNNLDDEDDGLELDLPKEKLLFQQYKQSHVVNTQSSFQKQMSAPKLHSENDSQNRNSRLAPQFYAFLESQVALSNS